MNKKMKFTLVGILATISIIIAVNFNRIKFVISILHIYKNNNIVSEQIDQKDKPIVENPLLNIVKNETPVDNNINHVDNQNHNSILPKKLEESTQSNEPAKYNKDPILESQSLVSIAALYNEKLESMESEFLRELEDLISRGYEEYNSGKISTSELGSKYLTEGSNLEKYSDRRFNALVKEMETKLIENGHDTNLVKYVNTYYKSFKAAKKDSILNKALKYKNNESIKIGGH